MARFLCRSMPLALAIPPNSPSLGSVYACKCLRFSSSSRLISFDSRRSDGRSILRRIGCMFSSEMGYRKARRVRARKNDKELEFKVMIRIEEQLPDDPEIVNIAEMLHLNASMAMKLAFDGLKTSKYKTRQTTISDLGGYDCVELSLLLCNDEFIKQLNKEWRDEYSATDVLSLSQHIPELKIPVLMFGDIAISVETASRQAEERGHSLLDETRILLVHGLLHLLGFDHELSEEGEAEMEAAEVTLLKALGWKEKGLIKRTCEDAEIEESPLDSYGGRNNQISLRFNKPKFRCIFCDMDGTLLNSKSEITPATADAIRESSMRGINVIIATGKTRAAALTILRKANLVGESGVFSENSPGVFLQGLLVYGRQGRLIYRRNLDSDVCREAFFYSKEHKVPLVAFSGDRCLTLFDHPTINLLHETYNEPKAEIMPSGEHILAAVDVQKLLFMGTSEFVCNKLRPYFTETLEERATVIQALPEMLEIVPHGASKGDGVRSLLTHMGIEASEVMAIGDGDNDVEMLELASFGVAMRNGSEKAKAAGSVVGDGNDEDGVADAIYKYAF